MLLILLKSIFYNSNRQKYCFNFTDNPKSIPNWILINWCFYQAIILLGSYSMLKVAREMPGTPKRPKRSESTSLEDSDNDGKLYRALLSIFLNNLNFLTKTHKDCLGEIDFHPKMKVSREEQQSVLDQLEKVYFKMGEKISRDSIQRNSLIKKSLQAYFEIHPDAKNKKQPQVIEQKEEKLLIPQSKQLLSERKTNLSGLSHRLSSKRPVSSKEVKPMNLLSRAFQNFQSSSLSNTYKMKTISVYDSVGNPEIPKEKVVQSKTKQNFFKKEEKNRYQGNSKAQKEYEEFLFNGQEIMINERRGHEREDEVKSRRRLVSLKFTQRRSIEQIEKMQIQNRIMMISSALSVSLAQPQGYKAKGRCWQNYFN